MARKLGGESRGQKVCLPKKNFLWNDHPEGLAPCKWSSGWTGPLQMIFWMDRPLANDRLDGPASCKRSSFFSPLFFFSAKNIFFQIFSSFSFTVNLFLCIKTYFPSPNIFLIFHPHFSSPPKNTFSFSLYNLLFHLRFISPQQKNSFYKYIIVLFLLCSSSPLKTQNSKF